MAAGEKNTADSSNQPKKRTKIKTFYDYCQEEKSSELIPEVNKLPYLQGLETQMRRKVAAENSLTAQEFEKESPNKSQVLSKKKSKLVKSPYL